MPRCVMLLQCVLGWCWRYDMRYNMCYNVLACCMRMHGAAADFTRTWCLLCCIHVCRAAELLACRRAQYACSLTARGAWCCCWVYQAGV
jgi:hypothetical protein